MYEGGFEDRRNVPIFLLSPSVTFVGAQMGHFPSEFPLTLQEKKMEKESRKNGFEPFEYDEEGHPIKARWEMVSLHTARRTFITNVYLSGKFSIEFMMKLSGHKKYDTFKKYVRLSLDEYADDIAKNADNCLF